MIIDNTTDKVYVCGISWERIFVKFEIRSELEEPLTFKLRLFSKVTPTQDKNFTEEVMKLNILKELPITPTSYIDGLYTFDFNITCIDGRTFLDNGLWQIQAYQEGVTDTEKSLTCSVTNEVAYQLDDLSRLFPYDAGKYSYVVGFQTYSDERQILSFVINSRFMIENPGWKKRRYVQEALSTKGKFNRMYMWAVIKMIRAYYKIMEPLHPKNGKNVLFMTETKPYLWGNLKYINDRMVERGLDKEFNISYSLRNAVGQHKSIGSWVKLITEIAKQDFIFVDDYVPVFGFLDLNERTKLIQVWHAGVGFKSVGYSRFGKTGSPFPVGSCHKKYDYAITGSEQLVHVYEEVFGIPESAFLPLGMARLDGFLDPDKINSFKEKFYGDHSELIGKKLILFAPTYRGSNQKNAYYDYQELDLKEIYDFCGDEYVWAFKMHPFTKKAPSIPEEYRDRIIDLSKTENINDLYYVTEILITDYSSAYFEFALMEKPVIFFTYDREIYELTRGVHRPIKESAPGKVCDTFAEMMDALRNKDYDYERTQAFIDDYFRNYDGKASDKIIDVVLLGKKE